MTTHSSLSNAIDSPLLFRRGARARSKTKRQIEVTMFVCGAGEIRELVGKLVKE
jgi:hypothetical protein